MNTNILEWPRKFEEFAKFVHILVNCLPNWRLDRTRLYRQSTGSGAFQSNPTIFGLLIRSKAFPLCGSLP